jgi:di/tricarboxylate transporter
MSTIKNIINDTLKSRGKWSMKRLTVFVVLVLTLILGAFIVLSDLVLKVEVNKYAQGIFDSLLLFLAALMGVTEFGKKMANKEVKTEEING